MDATRLRHGLQDYIDALQRQLVEMRDQGYRLDAAWQVTRNVYRGEGADMFANEFGRSRRMLSQYVEALEQVLPILRERLASLERFDSGSDQFL